MKYSKPSCLQHPSGWPMHVGGSGLQSNPTRVPAHKEHAASFKLYSHSSTVYSKAPHSERTQLKRIVTRSAVYNHRSGRRMARADGDGDRWTHQKGCNTCCCALRSSGRCTVESTEDGSYRTRTR